MHTFVDYCQSLALRDLHYPLWIFALMDYCLKKEYFLDLPPVQLFWNYTVFSNYLSKGSIFVYLLRLV